MEDYNNNVNLGFKKNYKEYHKVINLNWIKVSKVKNKIIIESIEENTNIKSALIYDVNTDIFKNSQDIKNYKGEKELFFSLFCGLKSINNENYLVFVNNCLFYDYFHDKEIFKIIDVIYLNVNNFKINDLLFEKYNDYNLYFSFTLKLNKYKNKLDKLFFINYHMVDGLIINKCNDWIISIVDGYFFNYIYVDKFKKKLKIYCKILKNIFYNNDKKLFLTEYSNFLGFNSKLVLINIVIIIDNKQTNEFCLHLHPYIKRIRVNNKLIDPNINTDFLDNKYINNDIIIKNDINNFLNLCLDSLNIKDFYIFNFCSKFDSFINFIDNNEFLKKINIIDILNKIDINQYLFNMIKNNDNIMLLIKDTEIFLNENLSNIIISYINYKIYYFTKENLFIDKLDEKNWRTIIQLKLANFNFNKILNIKNLFINSYNYFNKEELRIFNEIRNNLFEDYNLKMLFFTLNLGGFNFNDPQNFYNIFYIKELEESDIIVLCFQELFEMKIKNFTKIFSENNKEEKKTLIKCLVNFLKKYNFNLFFEKSLSGIITIIFIKFTCPLFCDITEKSITRLGLNKTMGNKGFVYCNLKIYDTNIGIINCHLSANDKNFKKRESEFNEIIDLFKTRNTDFNILLGDLNFRSLIPSDDNFKYINKYYISNNIQEKQNCINEMLKGDAFKVTKNNEYFKEGKITFLPTYKYDWNSAEFSEKNNPSYCDRIFYKNLNLKEFKELSYFTNKTSFISDHRCVISQIQFKSKTLDINKYNKLLNIKFFR